MEFYPRDPFGREHGRSLTDTVECPKSPDQGFEPLAPAGFSESAFAVVHDEPIGDISSLAAAIAQKNQSVRSFRLSTVSRYRADAQQAAVVPLTKPSNFRGVSGKIQLIEDPTLELLESLHGRFVLAEALRIPMDFREVTEPPSVQDSSE